MSFVVLSLTVLNTFTLQMCFCISARLYLIVSGHFGLLAYSAEHRKSLFLLLLFSVGEHSVHPYSLVDYSCYLNVCNQKWCVVEKTGPAAAWMSGHRKHQWSMIGRVLSAAAEWQHSVWATKRASHAPLTLAMWNSRNRHSLSFRKKIAWVFESRSHFFNN